MTYARSIKFDINPGKKNEFDNIFKTDVLPMLKKQDGFNNEMIMVKENHGVGISFWNSRESIDKYHTTVYPEIQKKLTPFLTGTPTIEVYEVTTATFSKN